MTQRIVFITGASSGIGAAIAQQYIRAGHRVAAVARRTDRLEALQRQLGSSDLFPLCADVTQDLTLKEAVDRVHARFGLIDTVFANAGFGVVGNTIDLQLMDFHRQFETNVYGVLRTLQATLTDLTQTRGRFAVTGSVAGFISLPGGAAYSMSKFAIRALCDALYFELKPQGISVIHIAPGFVVSQIHQVDNEGRFHPQAKHRIPNWLRAPTHRAASEIFRAVEKRKREQIVTFHGKALTWAFRFFPNLMRSLIDHFALRARPAVSQP